MLILYVARNSRLRSMIFPLDKAPTPEVSLGVAERPGYLGAIYIEKFDKFNKIK